MNKAWSLFKDKAIINFSKTYPDTFEKVLDSHGFHSLLEIFLKRSEQAQDKNNELIKEHFSVGNLEDRIQEIIKVLKLLTIMNAQQLKDNFPDYSFVYDNNTRYRAFIEDLYTYWRNLERYATLYDGSNEGLGTSSFIEAKKNFDNLILNLYRKTSNNISMNKPKLYRQIPAGTNVGLILKEMVWPVPNAYSQLKWIPFIKEAVIEAPFITYPKKNKRDGVFQELQSNPLQRANINSDQFIALPIWVGNLLAFVFCHRNFLTHLISLTNLFEMAKPEEVEGHKPNLLLVFGADDQSKEPFDGFYFDKVNEITVGYISNNDHYDYFGYMKKMVLTLHNTFQIKKGNLPIHGAMVSLKTRKGHHKNIVIMGDSGAGKSESIEAFRVLADEYISNLTIIFDDMGTLALDPKNKEIKAYGTETGAFVRLDDLDAGYAFKQLDRSIFMNPDRINARLITPISTYEEIIAGEKIDLFLYANNYDRVEEGQSSIHHFDDINQALDTFVSGKRMAKGTTTEEGLTSSYFANPFGPLQLKEECDLIINKYFQEMVEQGVYLGEIKTQLGISGMEKEGPQKAALDLFQLMQELDEEK